MENKDIKITMNVAQWNAVLGALGMRPYAEVAEIIEAIKAQAAQQLSAAAPADEAPVED
jgi:uncharacterized protein YciI